MTTPSTNIGLGAVQTEFGGSNPVSMSEYYRGGSYVSSACAAGTSGVQISTSGAIRLGDFRAVVASTPVNFGGTLSGSRLSASAVVVTLRMDTDGNFSETHTAGASIDIDTITGDDWFSPITTSIGNSYWVRATLTSGLTPSSGSGTDTWLALTSQRTWSYNSGTGGAVSSRSGTLLLEVSSSSGGTPVVCSGSVYIYSERES